MKRKMICIIVALCMLFSASAMAEIARISDEPMTLTHWCELGEKASQVITNNNEIAAYRVLEEKTGVHIDWIHPSTADKATQLSLMIASNQLTDIVSYNWTQYSGGLSKMLADGVIIPLNDLIDEYAPNFKAILESNPEIAKQVTLDDGTIAAFPSIRTDTRVRVWFGPQIRQDWLDRLGLEMPTTMDEWYNVLCAFRDEDANGNGDPYDEIPFVAAGASSLPTYFLSFTGAYKPTRADYCINDGKVVFGPAQPAYKEYLAEMAKWYDEELIDPDFAAVDIAYVQSLVTTDQAGAYFGSLAGNLGKFNAALQEIVPEGRIVGAPYPLADDGKNYQVEPQHGSGWTGFAAAVTTACENPVEAVKWLDAHLSEEGSMLMNFGVEGESYEMVDGYPKFTDEIFNNPDGLAFDVAMAKYSLAPNTSAVMNQDFREFEQYSLGKDFQRAANALWAEPDKGLLMPPLSLTSEESTEFSRIMNEVNTYVVENTVKFIMGQKSLDEFDSYVEAMYGMGLERALEIQQAAYDRYLAR